MTLTEDLILEHNAIEEMLSIMTKIAGNIEKDKEFDTRDVEKIIDFLRTFADKCHHGKEETALFPALVLSGIQEDNDQVDVMLQEHNVGRGYINGLIAGVEDYKNNFANSYGLVSTCLTNYVNLLHSHIQKEEDMLFPMANKVLSEQKRNEILEQFKIIEEEVIGHGDLEQYQKLLKQLKIKYIDSSSQ
ncbi:MAG TPA: hemerythrin domain-containing protein [Bacteroidales bacterium]|nr:hemerythrin domain-containing protein [Bacteroidales bacterium]